MLGRIGYGLVMSIDLQLVVSRGTARGLINGSSAADYGEVISLCKVLYLEGDYQLAADLLELAKSLQPTSLELAEFGSIDESSLRMKGAWEGMTRHSPPVANPRFKG
ncbi:hypothetical protein ACLM44_01540 [Synechococcus sp. W2B2]|uniref:hypothetical protein n=1 Tax=unclassified Synechococcus TaxID=2626047 RepID=UPI000306736D|nr:hypothetical protein [Synechococcus sp. WH 7805]